VQREGEQLFLVGEVVVQNPVGDFGLAGDGADGEPGAAVTGEKSRGGGNQVFPQGPVAAVAQSRGLPR